MIASGLMNSAYGLRLYLAEVRLLRCMSESVCRHQFTSADRSRVADRDSPRSDGSPVQLLIK